MQSKVRFVRFCLSTFISVALCSSRSSASDDNTYSWQPVQENMRMRNGDYKTGISNEEVCKTRCGQISNCIGVDWNAMHRNCFHLYDSGNSPYSENGYSHWRITRNRSPPISSQVTPTKTTTVGSYTPAVNTDAVIDVTMQESNKGDFYTWQSVQLDMRVKVGEIRQDLQSEIACKANCLRSSSCAGVFWYNLSSICIFHTDCNAKLFHESGFRYWKIQKYAPTPTTCQNLIIRDVQQVGELSLKCDLQHHSASAVNVLGVVLSVSMVVIIALLINTYRLNRKIQKLASPRNDGQLVQQVQEQRHQSNNSYQHAVYMEMIGETGPRTSDSDNAYDVLDENRRQY